MIYRVPICVKEIVDTWKRHSPEIQRINPTWNGLYVGAGVMLATVTLKSQELYDNWLTAPSNYKEVINLIDAFKDNYVPAIMIVGSYIRPIFDRDLSNFRRWLDVHFYLRADDD